MAIIEMKVPELAESITEVTLAQFLISDGDVVEMDQPICEMETDKASQELFAEKAGKVTFVAEEGADLAVGALICTIDTSVAPAPKTEAPAATPKPAPQEKTAPVVEAKKEESYAKGHASPAASKMIAENNLDASSIQGSGPGGRITKADVLKAFAEGSATIQQGAEAMVSQSKAFARTESEAKMSRLRRTISERLVFAKNSTAMLTTFNEVDMKPIMDLRRKHKEKFKEAHGVNLGFMSFFVKACVVGLKLFPAINAEIEGQEIIYKNYYNISFAVGTEKGLVVPVLKNADEMSFADIEKEIKNLSEKAKNNSLVIEDLQGGTFTISNGGVYGSMLSTPILNPPQSGVLGMHNIVERPVVQDNEIKVKPIMYLALSYDHRIIDGKDSVSFLKTVKENLEDPRRLFLNI